MRLSSSATTGRTNQIQGINSRRSGQDRLPSRSSQKLWRERWRRANRQRQDQVQLLFECQLPLVSKSKNQHFKNQRVQVKWKSKDQHLKNQVKQWEIKMISGFTEEINGFESTTGFEPHSLFLNQNLVDHKLIDVRINVRRGLSLKAVISSIYVRMNETPRTMPRTSSTSLLWDFVNGLDQPRSSNRRNQVFKRALRGSSSIPRLRIKPSSPRRSKVRSSRQLLNVLNMNLRIYLFDRGVGFVFDLGQRATTIGLSRREDL